MLEHWELSRRNMEMFITPKGLMSEVLKQLGSERPVRKPRIRKMANA